jgi:DNA (cytosine-5)-methyltransferase 1
MQRFYILTTGDINNDGRIDNLINKAKNEHGVQIILNGIFPTIKYYLRLISNTDDFIEYYLKNLELNSGLDYEHKISWNDILSKKN